MENQAIQACILQHFLQDLNEDLELRVLNEHVEQEGNYGVVKKNGLQI
jgi:hypothetical protein